MPSLQAEDCRPPPLPLARPLCYPCASLTFRSLPQISRYTMRRHIPAEILLQIYVGATFAQFDIVARKEFDASNVLIALLCVGPHAPLLLSAFWGATMAGRSRGIFLAVAAVFGPLLLLGMPFVHSAGAYTLLCGLSLMGDPILVPFRNRLLQANYDSATRGAVWGWIFAIGRVAHLSSSLSCGLILDHFPGSHRLLFPAAGFLGLTGIFLYSRIRLRHQAPEGQRMPRAHWWHEAADVFRKTPRFAAFEGAFMFYGFAFMFLLPLHVVVVNDILKLSYTQAALLRQVLPQIVLAAISPLAGRLLDRSTPLRMGAYAFTLLAFFPAVLGGGIAWQSVPLAALAYFLFGAAMAFLHSAWELGPTWFAGERDVSPFMGIHVSCVGVRGTLGPPIGSFLAGAIGLGGTFAISSALFAAAAFWMRSLYKSHKQERLPPGTAHYVPSPGATRLPPRGA